MKFNRINLKILDKSGMQKLAFHQDSNPIFLENFSRNLNEISDSKNVILSGEFYSMNEKSLIEKLFEQKMNVQVEITPETEILICGQYPDWVLVEEARHCGIRIIFADKAGESFSRMATKLINNKTAFSVDEPLEV